MEADQEVKEASNKARKTKINCDKKVTDASFVLK